MGGVADPSVATEGWDNRTFHLGDSMSLRLPSAEPYALAVDNEHLWLPVLASQLPLPIPAPPAKGRPGEGYPHPWSVYAWLPGKPGGPRSGLGLAEGVGRLGPRRTLRQPSAAGGAPHA